VLEFQRGLSTAISQQVLLRLLLPERLDRMARRQTRNIDAYDLYLRRRYFWSQLSPLTTRRAPQFYTCATEFDPDYADASSGSSINLDGHQSLRFQQQVSEVLVAAATM
jgi:hypothetical protein